MVNAATLLRTARRAVHQSQRALANVSGTKQPQIADVERGRHDITVASLSKLLAATGHRLVALPTTGRTAAEAADAIRSALRAADPDRALREALQLSDDLRASTPGLRAALTQTIPAGTGDQRYDALIAGLVEHHLTAARVAIPGWVHDPQRTLAERWWVDHNPLVRELNESETPLGLLAHGVVFAASELDSV